MPQLEILRVFERERTNYKYAVLLPQHVSGVNMPIIRSTVNKQLPLLGGHTWKIYAK
jgi:hypothetical protein